MRSIKKVQEALKEVYSSKKFFVITTGVTVFLFLFNTLVNNYRILLSDFSFSLFLSLLTGTISTMTTSSLILLLIMSVLAGVVLAMTIFLVKRQVKESVGASTSGIFVSLIAPACPSCAIGLLSVLGLGGFLAFLPFKGLELGILGIILLIASLIYLSKKIVTEVCEIKK